MVLGQKNLKIQNHIPEREEKEVNFNSLKLCVIEDGHKKSQIKIYTKNISNICNKGLTSIKQDKPLK